MLLGRLPIEIAKQRDDYYRARTRDQMSAVDNELARSQHPAMAIHKPERETRVTFGGSRKSED